jgi:copper(I)-binding protein
MLKKIVVATALLAASLLAHAHEYQAGSIHIEHPWSREMPAVAPTAAAYFVLHNQGKEADRLLGASTPVAQKAEIHQHQEVDGLMKMGQVANVEIAPGAEVKFAPMGYHVMLFGLKQQAKAGERFPLTLNFEKAGKVDVQVAVQQDEPASAMPEQHQHAH